MNTEAFEKAIAEMKSGGKLPVDFEVLEIKKWEGDDGFYGEVYTALGYTPAMGQENPEECDLYVWHGNYKVLACDVWDRERAAECSATFVVTWDEANRRPEFRQAVAHWKRKKDLDITAED